MNYRKVEAKLAAALDEINKYKTPILHYMVKTAIKWVSATKGKSGLTFMYAKLRYNVSHSLLQDG
jgi:hypothetical protein